MCQCHLCGNSNYLWTRTQTSSSCLQTQTQKKNQPHVDLRRVTSIGKAQSNDFTKNISRTIHRVRGDEKNLRIKLYAPDRPYGKFPSIIAVKPIWRLPLKFDVGRENIHVEWTRHDGECCQYDGQCSLGPDSSTLFHHNSSSSINYELMIDCILCESLGKSTHYKSRHLWWPCCCLTLCYALVYPDEDLCSSLVWRQTVSKPNFTLSTRYQYITSYRFFRDTGRKGLGCPFF